MESEEKRFGKYVLISKLAAGGMAVTYRAKMTAAAGLTKDVVIKKIHAHLAEEEDFIEMFVREAKLAASLTHGNIAQVFDFGKTDGDYFLAMELVHGQALSRVLRRSSDRDIPFLPTPIALQITCRMCDGLHYAHTRKDERGQPLNLVHRDVSPENTLLSYEGEVKVVDFGIAKSNSGGKQTETGMVKGKYPYFSPEQAQAARDLDARSDVYAVGVVLYEMVCGRRPYEGEFVAVLAQLAEGKLPPPSSFNPDISPELEQIMLKALATRRDERYQSCRELGQALSEVLHSGYPGSTSNDISMLVAMLFKDEQEAEGNVIPVSPEFATEVLKSAQPGYGAKRRAALGLKPESKATPKPATLPSTKTATPARPRSTSTSAQPIVNAHGGYRPKSMTSMPAASAEKTPPAGVTKLAPIEQETLLRNKAAKAAAPATTVNRTRSKQQMPRVVEPPKRVELTLDNAEMKEKRQRMVVTVGGIGAFISILLVAVLFIFGGEKKPEQDASEVTQLWVTSVPAGASVKVDNKDLGVTPVKSSVTVGPHTMAVALTGYRPWTKRFTAGSTAVTIPIKLEPAEEVAPEPPKEKEKPKEEDAPTEIPGADVTSAARRDILWPLRLFVLRPSYNALPLPKYDTANIELKPNVGYQVFTEGGYSLGKGKSSATVLYYLEGDYPENKRIGFLSGAPKLIKGATKMHVFVIDDDLTDNSGGLQISLRINQYVVPQTFRFDPQKHAIVPAAEHRFKLSNLNPASKYLLTIRDDDATIASGKNGHVTYVLCIENPAKARPIPSTHRLLEVGKRHKVSDTDSLTCVFPDMNPDDNSGSLEIDIVDMAELTAEERANAEK